MTQRSTASSSSSAIAATVGIVIAALYFAQEVLVPVALASMLAFLLAPLCSRLERTGLPRIPAVLTLTIASFIVLGFIGWTVGDQLYLLGERLPIYQDEIIHKMQSLHGGGGVIGRNLTVFSQKLETVTAADTSRPLNAPTTAPAGAQANPFYIVAVPQASSGLQSIGTYLKFTLGPVGTAGLVVVFVIFMLVKREDVRDRAISLISRGQYTVTTKALDDAATRISRYVQAQSIVNGSFGLLIGLGLWLIGLTFGHGTMFPSFPLWALLCAVLRFVPYIGAWVAAAFPLALALAVYPGFGPFIATAIMFLLVELGTNNLMEPWLYGASTGLSTVAILVAAVFWTWLWGPIGLLLSTPLTVCLAVLGKHVPQMKFLDVMLSDEPALPPEVAFYQRLLAGHTHELDRLMDQLLINRSPQKVFDEVLVPMLRLFRRERSADRLTVEDQAAVREGSVALIRRVTEKLAHETLPTTSAQLILGVPSHHRSEELTLEMLAATMQTEFAFESATTDLLPKEIEELVEEKQPVALYIAVLPPGGIVQARYLCRRLRRRFPEVPIVVGYFGRTRDFDALLVRLRSAGATAVTTSLAQAANQIRSLTARRVQTQP